MRRKHYHLTELRPLDALVWHERTDVAGPWAFVEEGRRAAVARRQALKASGCRVSGDIHIGDYIVVPPAGPGYRLRLRGCGCENGQAALKEKRD